MMRKRSQVFFQRLFWVLASLLIVSEVINAAFEIEDELAKQKTRLQVSTDAIADEYSAALHSWLKAQQVFSRGLGHRLEHYFIDGGQTADLQLWRDRVNHSLSFMPEAKVLLIENSQGLALAGSSNTDQNREILSHFNSVNEMQFTAEANETLIAYNWQIVYSSERQAYGFYSLVKVPVPQSEPVQLLIRLPMVFELPFNTSGDRLFLLDPKQTGFRIDGAKLQQVVLSSKQADSSNKPNSALAEHDQDFVNLHREIGIELVSLSSQSEIRYRPNTSPLAKSDWRLFVLKKFDGFQEYIVEEIVEAAFKLVITVLLLMVAYRMMKYHFEVKNLTYVDPLTNLYNRKHLYDFVPELFQLHDRDKLKSFVLIMLDIDHFKLINDKYGHDIGDKVLKRLGQLMSNTCRRSDRIYRLGGEEFAIFCIGDGLEEAIAFAERLRLVVADDQEVRKFLPKGFTVSLGVAERENKETLDKLYVRADHLLYQAKENGRNQVASQAPVIAKACA